MLRNIEIFNVNFGDCFIASSDNGEKMLVDFGSISPSINPTVISKVNQELSNACTKYLVVTHFHRDHYSGIQNLQSTIKFHEIYLPDFFSKNIIKLQFAILLALSAYEKSYLIACNLLNVIPDLTKHITNQTEIVFTRRGDTISNRIDDFRVLWPDNQDFDRKAEIIYREIIAYYNLENKQGMLEEITEEYFSTVPPLQEVENGRRVIRITREQQRGLTNLAQKIEAIRNQCETPDKKLEDTLRKKISDFQNSICLCFDNAWFTNREPILFLSDIDRNNYDYIYQAVDGINLAHYYRAIKVPHHGTKDYYINNLPNNHFMIISNGLSKKDSWRITALYGWKYKGSHFICTNYLKACDYEFANGRCDACKQTACICGVPVYCNLTF